MNNSILFSKERLLRLPHAADGKRDTYHDSKTTGLQLRVTSSGVKTFSLYRRTKGGQPSRITLGRFPEMTVEQARKQAAIANAEIEVGSDPAAVKRAHKGEPTFEECFDVFLENKRTRLSTPLSESTKRDYKDILRLHLGSIRGSRLSDITRTKVTEIHSAITARSAAQANKCVAMISAVYSFAIDREIYSGNNPATRIQKNAATERERFAQPDELPYLFRAINQSSLADFFWLALLTGARRDNLQSMSWRDLNLSDAVWRIPRTKNGEPLSVPLVPEAVSVLSRLKKKAKRGNVYVFAGEGETGHLVEPKASWLSVLKRASFFKLLDVMLQDEALTQDEYKEAQEAAEKILYLAVRKYHRIAIDAGIDPKDYAIDDLRIHDLRRTFGSWQNRMGANQSIIGKSLGHKTSRATQIYTRLDMDPVRQSVEAGTTAMLVAAGVKKTTAGQEKTNA